MKLLEYEAKAILQTFAIPTPAGELLENTGDMPSFTPCILKSQVPIGGRGKLGGVVVAKTPDEAREAISTLFALPIDRFVPSKLLAEEVIAIDRELYLSLAIDRSLKAIVCMAQPNGGVEIESIEATDFFRQPLTRQTITTVGGALADYLRRHSECRRDCRSAVDSQQLAEYDDAGSNATRQFPRGISTLSSSMTFRPSRPVCASFVNSSLGNNP